MCDTCLELPFPNYLYQSEVLQRHKEVSFSIPPSTPLVSEAVLQAES